MDTTPPTSKVSPLPQRGTSLTFPVSVTGIRRRLARLRHEVLRHLLKHQRRHLDALDHRPGLQPHGQLHRPEQHDLRLLQHRPRPGRQHRDQDAANRGQHLYSRPDRHRSRPSTALTGTNPSYGQHHDRHVHAQPHRHRPGRQHADLLQSLRISRFGRIPVGRTADSRRTSRQHGNGPRDHPLPGPHRRRNRTRTRSTPSASTVPATPSQPQPTPI